MRELIRLDLTGPISLEIIDSISGGCFPPFSVNFPQNLCGGKSPSSHALPVPHPRQRGFLPALAENTVPLKAYFFAAKLYYTWISGRDKSYPADKAPNQ